MKGIGAKDDVTELDAMGWNDVAKREIILAKEVGEVVKQDKEDTEGSPIQVTGCRTEIRGFQERCDEAQQGYK